MGRVVRCDDRWGQGRVGASLELSGDVGVSTGVRESRRLV